MSRVMTADQTSLREGRLKDILKMMEEGLLKVCNPILVIQMIHVQLINWSDYQESYSDFE